jgi:DNA-directed RNA polymerase specialized sigma24 family protein
MNNDKYVQLVTDWLNAEDVSQEQLCKAYEDLKAQQRKAEKFTTWNFDCPDRALFRSLEGASGNATGCTKITREYTAQHWLTVYNKRRVAANKV